MQDLAIKKQGIFILHYSECRAARLPRPRIKMAPVCRGGGGRGWGRSGEGTRRGSDDNDDNDNDERRAGADVPGGRD